VLSLIIGTSLFFLVSKKRKKDRSAVEKTDDIGFALKLQNRATSTYATTAPSKPTKVKSICCTPWVLVKRLLAGLQKHEDVNSYWERKLTCRHTRSEQSRSSLKLIDDGSKVCVRFWPGDDSQRAE
jgi:hypothetical protein